MHYRALTLAFLTFIALASIPVVPTQLSAADTDRPSLYKRDQQRSFGDNSSRQDNSYYSQDGYYYYQSSPNNYNQSSQYQQQSSQYQGHERSSPRLNMSR